MCVRACACVCVFPRPVLVLQMLVALYSDTNYVLQGFNATYTVQSCTATCDRGTCNGATCVCNPGWKGINCNEPACPNDCGSVSIHEVHLHVRRVRVVVVVVVVVGRFAGLVVSQCLTPFSFFLFFFALFSVRAVHVRVRMCGSFSSNGCTLVLGTAPRHPIAACALTPTRVATVHGRCKLTRGSLRFLRTPSLAAAPASLTTCTRYATWLWAVGMETNRERECVCVHVVCVMCV